MFADGAVLQVQGLNDTDSLKAHAEMLKFEGEKGVQKKKPSKLLG